MPGLGACLTAMGEYTKIQTMKLKKIAFSGILFISVAVLCVCAQTPVKGKTAAAKKAPAAAVKPASKPVAGKAVLLFDDLFRSGATLNAVTRVLYEQGQCSDVYALALTRTRMIS